ncbi:AfsR/SARP family transcriptional regulator [Actinorugispora endophytica]|nr:BTAD domain-containing putative transcriptional regulator [Actinorugispora endophytica]
MLGPLRASVDGRPVALGGRRARTALALLLLEPGRVVPVPRFVDALWEERPPASARTQVAIVVSGLRRAFREAGAAGDPIETVGSGYLLRPREARVDACAAAGLVARGRAAAVARRPGDAADALRAALSLWRGPVLCGLDSDAVTAGARRWEELRLAAAEELAEAEFALGRHREHIEALSSLVAEDPFQERFRALLMTALARAGRRADALAVYAEGHRVLSRELGVVPGRELRGAHEAILRDAPPARERRAAGPRVPAVRPGQLPQAVSAFTGRAAELAALDGLLERDERDRHLPVCVISGGAGVGKSGLALHWAHRAADRFPDGQLFADLHGGGPRPMAAGVVLGRFLHALGVPRGEVPTSLEERAALYRSVLRDRRVLVLLDDAASERQALPLLPGSHRCCVVVTARTSLSGLAARSGALVVRLAALNPAESADLLRRVAGTARLPVEPAAVARLGEACGGLPMALRSAVVRLQGEPRPAVPARPEAPRVPAQRGR